MNDFVEYQTPIAWEKDLRRLNRRARRYLRVARIAKTVKEICFLVAGLILCYLVGHSLGMWR
jgi:hypothetical protein